MATLEKIRSKGILIIIVVGIALISFIVGDFLTQGATVTGRSRERVAEINREKINIAEYQEMLNQITIFQKYESGQPEIDEQTMSQMRAYIWDQMIAERLLWAQAKKLGLEVTTEELSERLIGNNIHPLIQQRRFFADENGQFSRAMLIEFLNYKDEDATDPQMQEALLEYRKLWIFLERTVKFAILQEKYNALISNTMVANSAEAKRQFDLNNTTIDLNYVLQPYFTVHDTAVTVTDKEIRDRYNARLEHFRQEPNVSLKLVNFRVQPSPEDFKEAEEFINNLKDEFSTSADIVELVNRNSDIPYTGNNYSRSTVPSVFQEFAFSGNVGDVVGPLFNNNTYTMARIMETGIMTPDSVRLRHIFLVTANEGKTDSIITAIRGGASFGDLARTYSAVQQTAQNNGEIGWILEGDQALDRNILRDAFAKNPNDIFTFKNAQGTQIIQIMEKTAPRPKVKLAILERAVTPSSRTVSDIFNSAKRFAAGLSAELFDSIAAKQNYPVRVAREIFKTNERILDIPNSRQIIRWAFENRVGKVSDVFECDNEFVVALITEINDSRYRTLQAVTDQLRNEIIRDKKAEVIINQLKDKITNDTTLVGLASAIGQEVKQAFGVNFGAQQFGLSGFEPAVIGKATSLSLNQVSAPIKGNAGVFVLAPVRINQQNNSFDVQFEKQMLRSRFAYTMPNLIMRNLRENATITDNRLLFY